jgi:hypothetical protein
MPLSFPCSLSFIPPHAFATTSQAAAFFRDKHACLFQVLTTPEQSPYGASTAKAIGARLSFHSLADGLRGWGFKFHALLERNLRIYMRNPGNALARFLVYTSVGIAAGVLCYDIGKNTGPRASTDFMGK